MAEELNESQATEENPFSQTQSQTPTVGGGGIPITYDSIGDPTIRSILRTGLQGSQNIDFSQLATEQRSLARESIESFGQAERLKGLEEVERGLQKRGVALGGAYTEGALDVTEEVRLQEQGLLAEAERGILDTILGYQVQTSEGAKERSTQVGLGLTGYESQERIAALEAQSRETIANIQASTELSAQEKEVEIARIRAASDQEVAKIQSETAITTTGMSTASQQFIASLDATTRANIAQWSNETTEAVARLDAATREKIAGLDNTTAKWVASLDAQTREKVAKWETSTMEAVAMLDAETQLEAVKLNNESAEKIARESLVSEEQQAQWSIEAQKWVASLDAATAAKVAKWDNETREKIASLDSETREKIANLDADTREGLAKLDSETLVKIARLDNATQRTIAQWSIESQKWVADLDATTRENIATWDNDTRTAIAQMDTETRSELALLDSETAKFISHQDNLTAKSIAKWSNSTQRWVAQLQADTQELVVGMQLNEAEAQRLQNAYEFEVSAVDPATGDPRWMTELKSLEGRDAEVNKIARERIQSELKIADLSNSTDLTMLEKQISSAKDLALIQDSQARDLQSDVLREQARQFNIGSSAEFTQFVMAQNQALDIFNADLKYQIEATRANIKLKMGELEAAGIGQQASVALGVLDSLAVDALDDATLEKVINGLVSITTNNLWLEGEIIDIETGEIVSSTQSTEAIVKAFLDKFGLG